MRLLAGGACAVVGVDLLRRRHGLAGALLCAFGAAISAQNWTNEVTVRFDSRVDAMEFGSAERHRRTMEEVVAVRAEVRDLRANEAALVKEVAQLRAQLVFHGIVSPTDPAQDGI